MDPDPDVEVGGWEDGKADMGRDIEEEGTRFRLAGTNAPLTK